MKLETYLKKLNHDLTPYARCKVTIQFIKNGVDQTWGLYFNKGKLLTDEVNVFYGPSIRLRKDFKCKSLNDVLVFLYDYSFSPTLTKIINIVDLLDSKFSYYSRLKSFINIKIDFNSVKGTLYWGRYEIIFENGYVTFIGHLSVKVNDGTYEIKDKRNLLRIVNKLVGTLESEIDFLNAVKNLEIKSA